MEKEVQGYLVKMKHSLWRENKANKDSVYVLRLRYMYIYV